MIEHEKSIYRDRYRMVLPPGYEDAMYCRRGDSPTYVNPRGFVGAASSFWKCRNSDHGTYDGIWIGARRNRFPEKESRDEYECVRGDCEIPTVSDNAPTSYSAWACTIL